MNEGPAVALVCGDTFIRGTKYEREATNFLSLLTLRHIHA